MLEAQEPKFPESPFLRLAPHRGIASIAAFAATRPALEKALNITLPPPGQTAEQDGVRYLWSGPNAWLAMATEPDIAARLAAAAGSLAAVTDQSDGRAIFLTADNRTALAKLLPIDLHETAFPSHATALTLAGHIPVQIWRENGAFALACFRSYANSLHHALMQAFHPG